SPTKYFFLVQLVCCPFFTFLAQNFPVGVICHRNGQLIQYISQGGKRKKPCCIRASLRGAAPTFVSQTYQTIVSHLTHTGAFWGSGISTPWGTCIEVPQRKHSVSSVVHSPLFV
ncbi:unnamed protein product, partial [Laminaria digitata]